MAIVAVEYAQAVKSALPRTQPPCVLRGLVIGLVLLSMLVGPGLARAAVGDVDPAFDPNPDGYVTSLVAQRDGSTVMGGFFGNVGVSPVVPRSNLARLEQNGLATAAFSPNVDNIVEVVAAQPDGKLVVGGLFATVDGAPYAHVTRLKADGSIDPAFANPAVASLGGPDVIAIAIQPDGKILIGGLFESVGGAPHEGIARLNSNGTVDTGFTAQLGPNEQVWSIAVQSDGAIVIGGVFSSVNGQPRNNVARLLSDGSLDAGFDPNANESIEAVAVQPDGGIVIGGRFTSIGAVTRNHLARLEHDGTLDTAFDAGLSPNAVNDPTENWSIRAIAVQADGKIVVGGNAEFVLHSGFAARVNPDGVLDPTFVPDVNNPVSAAAVQDDGKVVLGGTFALVGQTARAGAARVYGGPPNAAPRAARAVAGDGRATVTWDALAGEITGYTVRSEPGGRTCSVSAPTVTCAVEGLANGTAYTFTITAANVFGAGPVSAATSAVIPTGASAAATTAPSSTTPGPSARPPVALPGSVQVIGVTVIMSGLVPASATLVSQTARRADGTTRTVRCRVAARPAGLRHRYVCTNGLSPGRWRLTTVARGGGRVVARNVRTVVIARPHPAETRTG